MIPAIGAWIFRQACSQLKQWCKAGIDHIRVAVNTCANELLEPGYLATLAEFGLQPGSIEIELTERDAIELNGHNAGLLDALRGMGFLIVLDDFGTGFSSLSYLRGLPIDIIKLDRSFVHDIPCTQDAEGVETNEQAAFLQQSQCQCQCLQGCLYSRALRPEAATAWLRRE